MDDDTDPARASQTECGLIGSAKLDPPPTPTMPAALREYRLDRELGRGGMGVVYEAWHTKLFRSVAVKVLSAELTRHPEAVTRFERELRAIGPLNHPHVVQAFDAGEVDGVHFLVMERIDGEDLSTLLQRRETLPVAEACELIRQAAEGLQCVHEHQMVHRDIKPSNLMLARDGQVKLLDLGLAMLRQGNELTGTGQQMGTFDYMAPEQRDNSREVDIRADIYSLGATLYKLLCGQPRFMAETWAETKQELKQRDVPQPLINLLKRLLAKDPASRMAEPKDVARALEPFTDGANLQSLFLTVDELADASAQQPSKTDKSGRRWRTSHTIALAGVFVFLAAALTIHVVTDRGVLVIETFDDDLKVEIQKNGKSIGDAWKLEAGENRMTIRSGQYVVVIVGENAGKFNVDEERVTLTRNGEKRVQITRVPKLANVGPNSIVPNGKVQAAQRQPIKSGSEPPPVIVPFDSQQADKHQLAWAKHLGLAPSLKNSLQMSFRLIPPGKFTLGDGQGNSPAEDWTPHPVGKKAANPWQLYDMQGNVSEWCADYYAPYRPDSATDPLGPSTGKDRVVRRGNWNASGGHCVLYSRGPIDPAHRSGALGFRVAVVLKTKSD